MNAYLVMNRRRRRPLRPHHRHISVRVSVCPPLRLMRSAADRLIVGCSRKTALPPRRRAVARMPEVCVFLCRARIPREKSMWTEIPLLPEQSYRPYHGALTHGVFAYIFIQFDVETEVGCLKLSFRPRRDA